MSLAPPPRPGARVGRYVLQEPIGAGGMATVFRALDPHGDPYAVKLLDPSRLPAEEVKRFEREYRALSRMDHPNIVRVYEAGVHDGYPWIAMELVDGLDLEATIAGWRAAPPADRFARIDALLRQLCAALQYVHDRWLIHRDIKPSNILLTADGTPKLTDFGVVKGNADNSTHITQLTMAGRLVGTVAFMAPELITSDEDVDARADLYSLGAVLYLMLCFRRPIEADSVAGYLARHLTEQPVPAGQVDPDVPPRLERIASRLLQKDRAHRYPSASAVAAALDSDQRAERPALQGRERQLQGWSRRMAALRDGAGGCVVLSGVAGGGKSHLLEVMAEQATTAGLRVVVAAGWAQDPLDGLARAAGLDPEGSLGAGLARALFASLAGRPSVVAVDDLDRAPRRTIDAITRALRERQGSDAAPTLLLASATSLDAIAALVNGSATGMPADLMPVGAVDARAAVSMLRDRGVVGPLGAVLGRRLHGDYHGLPGPMLAQLDALMREGWIAGELPSRQPTRPLSAFRSGELPVPAALAEGLLRRLDGLSPGHRGVLDALAVIGRPAGGALLARCSGVEVGPALDELCARGLVTVTEDEQGLESFALVDPIAPRVLRRALSADALRALHAAVADALSGRRRRSNQLEVARHLDAAGRAPEAYPLYVTAARRAARRGTPAEVLDICEQAEGVRAAAEAQLDPTQGQVLREQHKRLEAEACVTTQDWAGAQRALRLALAAARANDSDGVGPLLAASGRTWYRLGDHRRARPLLEQALDTLPDDAPERGPALRALADLLLHAGELEQAGAQLEAALGLAQQGADRDGEARARRGLAHLRIFQGQLVDAARLLVEADDLLALGGDPQVRAAVLARSIEVATLTGRWGSAVRQAERLVEVARRHELAGRLPDAYSLLAIILLHVGATDEALDAASQARVFAAAHPDRIDAQLRTARALLELGRLDEASQVLPDASRLPAVGPEDPPALHGALRARLLASTDPQAARELAIWSLRRPPRLLRFRAAVVALDAARALLEAGDPATARTAAKRGLKSLQGLGADGLRLELLLCMQGADPDPRVGAAVRQVAARIAEHLDGPVAERFRARQGLS